MKKTLVKDRPLAWLFCPTCGKTNFNYRASKENYVCRVCGTVFRADKKKHKVKLVRLPDAMHSPGRYLKNK